MALFDTAHKNLYVALTGDCRAVAGVWEPTSDGKGTWRVDVLTEDQTAENPNEVQRYVLRLRDIQWLISSLSIISEHPRTEEQDVVRNGRILGGLQPSRAFGDARYKWAGEIQAM